MAPITYCMKQREFKWSNAIAKAIREIKKKKSEGLVMYLRISQRFWRVLWRLWYWYRWGAKSITQSDILVKNWMRLTKVRQWTLHTQQNFHLFLMPFNWLQLSLNFALRTCLHKYLTPHWKMILSLFTIYIHIPNMLSSMLYWVFKL